LRVTRQLKPQSRSALVPLAAGLLGVAAALILGAAPPTPVRPPTPASPPAADPLARQFDTLIKPFVTQYCYQCHGNGKKRGELALDEFTSLAHVRQNPNAWESVADALRQQVMPPKKSTDQPAKADVDKVLAWIDGAINTYDPAGPRDPGRVAIHRLNRTEYNHTIRDLVGVNFEPAADFPADDTGYGFDNIADVLSMSPLLAEKYLAAAEQIVDKAIVTDAGRRRAPRYDGLAMQPVGGSSSPFNSSRTARVLLTNGEAVVTHEFTQAGSYEVRVSAFGEQAGAEPPRLVLKLDDKELRVFDVPNEEDRPRTFAHRFDTTPGKRRLALAYVNNYVNLNHPDPKLRGDRNLVIEHVEIDGPAGAAATAAPKAPPPPESHRRIMFCGPGDGAEGEAFAAKIVERFATRAFRRPATPAEVQRFVKLYRLARTEKETFEQGIKVALTAVLISPHFLYRIELDPPAAGTSPHPLTDHELATRLSYFLWSSTPDDELLALAAANKLRDPHVLAEQVRRMLLHDRSAALTKNFVGQWLELRNLDDLTPDARKFPNFDGSLKRAMAREAELFFDNLKREDRSLIELLDADYTFANERLAKLYGIGGVTGDKFQRVKLTGTPRGGVVTMAGVLAVTSMPGRTSPVKRGKFLLDQILGTPPPPPPPDIPSLTEKGQDTSSTTMRQRLEQHRADANCSVCHMKLDPLGFSLENFDLSGAWRDTDGGAPVDSSGELPGGIKLDGPVALKKVLVERKAQFARCMAEKMLTYALGRGVEGYDRATVQDIVRHIEGNGYRFSSLVEGIVKCDAFRKRRAFNPAVDAPRATTRPAAK